MTLHTADREHNCASARCTDPSCWSPKRRREHARRWESAVPAEHRNYPPANLALGLPDEQLDAFPPELLDRVDDELVAEAIAVRDDRVQAELDDLADQVDEAAVVVDLQRAFDFKTDGYVPPAPELLVGRRAGSRRRRHDHRDVDDDGVVVDWPAGDPRHGLADIGDGPLASLLTFVWLHRNRLDAGDGLPARDQAVQDEWLNRGAGFGIVRKLVAMQNCALPFRYVQLARQTGRRSTARETILRLLMLLDAYGWNGFTISEHQAEDAGICSRAQWWRALGQLEAWGLLVHVRTYKNGLAPDEAAGSTGRTVGLCRNWYGPGPKLAELRDVYLAELGRGDSEDLAKHDDQVEQRRRAAAGARWRKRRGVERPQPAAEIPRWHRLLVDEARAAECFERGELDVEPSEVLDDDQVEQLGAALVAVGAVVASPASAELGAAGVSSAGVGASSSTTEGVTEVTALSLRERSTAGSELKLERYADVVDEDAPTPADDTPAAPSSAEAGDVEDGEDVSPCSSDEPSAGDRERCRSGHTHERRPSTPAGRTEGRHESPADASSTPATSPLQTPLALLATIDATASLLDAAHSSTSWSGARCPACGESEFDRVRGGLLRCIACRVVVVPD